MKKRVIPVFVLLLLTVVSSIHAQRLSTGVYFDMFGGHISRLPSDVIFSGYSYRAYYAKPIQTEKMMYFGIGGNMLFDYSRFFVALRFGISQTDGVVFEYSYPMGNQSFATYYSKIKLQQNDMQAVFGYFLNPRRVIRPYIEAGIGRNSPYFTVEDVYVNKDYNRGWFGREEISHLTELNKSYTYMTLAYGYRFDIMALNIRYVVRMGNFDTFYSYFNFGFSSFVNFSKLRKHYIYQPSE